MADGRRSLLDDDDEDEGGEAQLGYNQNYANRFVHNKKREDLHRLQELQKQGLAGSSDDESSSEEEDEDGLLPVRMEEKIFETLAKIKTRDPSIYSTETKFFDDVEEEAKIADVGPKVKKQKPLFLKDVNARHLLDGDIEDEEETSRKLKKPAPSYLTEQDELKRAFLEGVREAEGEEAAEDLLRVKKRTREELERDAREAVEAVEEAEQRQKDKTIAKRLEEYFGKDDDLDDNDKFLKSYLLNKGWIDQDERPRYPTYNDDVEDISEDEAALEEQDRFEKDYNFRFQEGNNTYVKGHSRIIQDSVRRKPDARKKQREKKRERESEEERARREELKRLKNVKKKEVLEKLERIRAVAGVGPSSQVEVLREDDLDDDFDPDEYDKKMKEAFGEEYYNAEDPEFIDADDLDDIEKPDFEDALLPIAPDSGAGFAAIKAKLDQSAAAKQDKKKFKVPFEEKLLIDKHLEEYYKLDYEDVIGDLPTRFKYRSVKANKYGLKTKDIIVLEDKELNQFVSLKKLAAYTTEEWQPRHPAPRSSSKGRRKKVLNSEGVPKKKKKAVVSHRTADLANSTDNGEEGNSGHAEDREGSAGSTDGRESEGTPESRKKGSTVEVITESTNLGNISIVNGKANFGNGEGSAGSKQKKTRKRKKTGTSAPLPMSRLLSYNPPVKKKMKR